MPPLKIGYLTQKDPHDRAIWSGIIHAMYDALGQGGQVEIIGPRPRPLWLRLLWHLLHRLNRLFGQRRGIMQSIPLSLAYGWYFSRQIRKTDCDVIFAPIAACELAFLRTAKPVFFYSDSTFAALVDYYFQRSEIGSLGLWEGCFLERRMARRTDGLIFASHWAAARSLHDDSADPSRVHVVPMGANFAHVPAASSLQAPDTTGHCRLLFVSRDWHRKGGPIAVSTLEQLRAHGIAASLTIVGCTPDLTDPDIRIIPSLDKRVPEQEQALETLFREAHFFLLPTRAECYGIVFCEASAYGLPCIATKTGGVPTAVAEGENGFLLPIEASGEAYAGLIASLWSDKVRYAALRTSTRAHYDRSINWTVWALSIRGLMEDYVAQNHPGPASANPCEG